MPWVVVVGGGVVHEHRHDALLRGDHAAPLLAALVAADGRGGVGVGQEPLEVLRDVLGRAVVGVGEHSLQLACPGGSRRARAERGERGEREAARGRRGRPEVPAEPRHECARGSHELVCQAICQAEGPWVAMDATFLMCYSRENRLHSLSVT